MNLESLEARLTEVENLILGKNKDPITPSTDPQAFPVNQLYQLHNALSLAEKRSSIASVFGRVNEIQKYIDPLFVDDDLLSVQSKVEIILSEREKIESMAKSMETIQSLHECLNNPIFSQVGALKQELNNLRFKHDEQCLEADQLLAQTKDVLGSYHTFLSDTSKLFIDWSQRSKVSA